MEQLKPASKGTSVEEQQHEKLQEVQKDWVHVQKKVRISPYLSLSLRLVVFAM
jgi:hypothetical protein